jgi:hypothetical protein
MHYVRPYKNMLHSAQKAAAERKVFSRFVEMLDQAKSWHSVNSRDPPEPDLLCIHAQRGSIAFELVAITDPLIAKVNARHSKLLADSLWTTDPTERIIRKKLGRRYVPKYPIELLIYIDRLVITPEDDIIRTTIAWLGSKEHQFTRAWFMGADSARSIWSAANEA